MKRLTPSDLDTLHTVIPGWTVEGEQLRKEFRFKTFRRAMQFVNAVAELATEARHHPDILVQYNRVTLTLTTHDVNGLTDQDLSFAREVESRELAR